MTEYKFTQDWFSWAPPVWEQLIPHLPERRSFLEIGSFEGRSTVWTIENMMRPGDWIDCVDTWEGGEEHGDQDMGSVEERFDHNIHTALDNPTYEPRTHHVRIASDAETEDQRKRVYKYKMKSTEHLGRKLSDIMFAHQPLYDFIYIDGSHIARDVLTDACMAWPLLNKGGFMVFDDYLWGEPRDILHRPKPAIDAFVNLFAEELDIVNIGYQLIIRKK
jgi:cephalosporin hydroxylase